MTDNLRAPQLDGIPLLVEQALSISSERPRVVRIEIPIAPIDPLWWLQAQPSPIKTYWADREGSFVMAGVGAAHVVSGNDRFPPYGALFQRLRAGLSCAHPNLRYYGGICFDAHRMTDPRWMRWGTHRFLIPRFELLSTGAGTFLVCNAFCTNGDEDQREVDIIRRELGDIVLGSCEPRSGLPAIISRHDRPDGRHWSEMVAKALDAFQEGGFEKVVLARESLFEFADVPDALAILRRLSSAVGNAYLFMFQLCQGMDFLGASPERLYRRVGGFIQSEALAGTRPRGSSDEADAALADVLLHDNKELREHRYVADSIRSAFRDLCKEIREDEEVSLVRLRDCQHLIRRFEGILADGKSEADVLEAIHPTPAVGGCPTGAALEWIAKEEPFDRGWFAGPVGWVGYDSSEFAVGIRSGLIDGTTHSLYAGAGIVSGSDAGREWTEVDDKLDTFSRVLTQDA